MAQDFGTPGGSLPPEPKKTNTTLIIILVVVAVLLCCCCLVIVLGWQYGDQIMEALGLYGKLIPSRVLLT
jgi:hypothetical protein